MISPSRSGATEHGGAGGVSQGPGAVLASSCSTFVPPSGSQHPLVKETREQKRSKHLGPSVSSRNVGECERPLPLGSQQGTAGQSKERAFPAGCLRAVG